jgi:hypothetical protein
MDLDFREHFGSNITYFLCYVINYLYAERLVTVLVPFHLLPGTWYAGHPHDYICVISRPVAGHVMGIHMSSVALYAGHLHCYTYVISCLIFKNTPGGLILHKLPVCRKPQ